MSKQFDKFAEIHASLPTVAFNPKWNNDTGYYDHAVKTPELNLAKGEMVAAISTAPNNRRIIIKGIGQGFNVVVFERYTPGINVPGILVSNSPSKRKLLDTDITLPYLEGALSEEAFQAFLDI